MSRGISLDALLQGLIIVFVIGFFDSPGAKEKKVADPWDFQVSNWVKWIQLDFTILEGVTCDGRLDTERLCQVLGASRRQICH